MSLSVSLGIILFFQATVNPIYAKCCPPKRKNLLPNPSVCADDTFTYSCCSYGTCDITCCNCNATCLPPPAKKIFYTFNDWVHKLDDSPFEHFYSFVLRKNEQLSFLEPNDRTRLALASGNSDTIFVGTKTEFKRLFTELDTDIDMQFSWYEYIEHLVDVDPASRGKLIFEPFVGYLDLVYYTRALGWFFMNYNDHTYEHFYRFNWVREELDSGYETNKKMRATLARDNGGNFFVGTKREFIHLFKAIDTNHDWMIMWREFCLHLEDVDPNSRRNDACQEY